MQWSEYNSDLPRDKDFSLAEWLSGPMMTEIAFIRKILSNMAVFVREKYAGRRELTVRSKVNPNDLVTEADLAVQRHVVDRIRAAFPNDSIVAEEEGLAEYPPDANVRSWLLDPIDGTQNFVRGQFPAFGISLAFVVGNEVAAGGVALPMTGDLFLAERGAGAFRNGVLTRVSDVSSLALARVEVDFGGPMRRANTLATTSELIRRAGAVRCQCAAAVSLCAIAAGDMDAYVHVRLNPWDYAAGQLIVEEAGGAASCPDGSPLRPFDAKKGVLVSNGRLHDELLAAIRG